MPDEGKAPVRARWRAVVPAPLRHGILIFLVVIVVEYLVVPELIGASRNIHYLERLNVGWLVAGVVLEATSLFAYALLTWTVLPQHRPNISRVFRIDLSTTAVAHTVPGGTAASAGLGYRLLTSNGVTGADAGFTMATQGIGSAVVLNVMLWLALVISIPIAGFHTIYIVVALLGMIALLFFGILVYLLTRGEEPAARFVRRIGQALPRVQPDRLEQTLRHIGDALRSLTTNRERLRAALVWATANWLLDAAALWAFLAALGRYVDPFELFAAYGIANVLAAIPITPGGLGFVEASLPLLLASFGVTKNVALLSVLGWRIVNFWLPIPIGAVSYLSLKLRRGEGLRAGRRALAELTVRLPPPDPPPAS
ncbi:MAG: lysylphosphatidylglycerol synthase transmembrane domain-containing protein [Acidimicrobiales bacterium]